MLPSGTCTQHATDGRPGRELPNRPWLPKVVRTSFRSFLFAGRSTMKLRANSAGRSLVAGLLALTALVIAPQSAAAQSGYRLGTCDWTIRLPASEESFRFARQAQLSGIQYSFGEPGDGLDLRTRENRDRVRAIVKQTGVAIASLGIGRLNKVPLATTDAADQLVADCLEAMIQLKREAAALPDRALAAKVAPRVVLLAFFGKADINGSEERINTVIRKLRRFAPIAEEHGFVLGIESLLSAADHRRVMEGVGSPAVKVYYDTANSARMGYDIYAEIESLGTEYICEIHLKQDAALLGDGEIDFPRIKVLLDQMQYSGWLIIEGSKPRKMAATDAMIRNAVVARELFLAEGPIDPPRTPRAAPSQKENHL